MSSKNSTAQRDALKAQLFQMATNPDSPGSSQAANAVMKNAPRQVPPERAPKGARRAESKVAPVPEKAKVPPAGEGKAEKISVSLHPVDQVRAEHVEDALRKAGLVTRRAPTSFLLKVALAAFDEEKVENLAAIVREVRSQDGRGKWMKVVK